jgi:hypothetical protein
MRSVCFFYSRKIRAMFFIVQLIEGFSEDWPLPCHCNQPGFADLALLAQAQASGKEINLSGLPVFLVSISLYCFFHLLP